MDDTEIALVSIPHPVPRTVDTGLALIAQWVEFGSTMRVDGSPAEVPTPERGWFQDALWTVRGIYIS